MEQLIQPPTFGAQLKSLRRQQHLTQMELSRRARVGQSYISALERGVIVNPSRATRARLATALSAAELTADSRLLGLDAALMQDPDLTELLHYWGELTSAERSFLRWIARTIADRQVTSPCESPAPCLGEPYATPWTDPIAARDP